MNRRIKNLSTLLSYIQCDYAQRKIICYRTLSCLLYNLIFSCIRSGLIVLRMYLTAPIHPYGSTCMNDKENLHDS